MIFEDIKIKDDYFSLTRSLLGILKKESLLKRKKLVIGICGESGSGKSVTSICLQRTLKKQGIHSAILHQDSYYRLAPKENHLKRKENINWVGPNEINMDLLQEHINDFKAGKEILNIPIVDYKKNTFAQMDIILKQKSVLLIEGVYSFFLDHIDYKIFLEKTYTDTLDKRKKRTREVYDPYVESVLEIEHNIIRQLRPFADIVIDKNYMITS